MSTKLSFFDVPGLDVEKLAQLIAGIDEERFTHDSSAGFLIEKRSENYFEGKYIQRTQVSETLYDPFGAEYKQEALYFSEQRFALSVAAPHLTIYNSSSLLRTLIGRLSEFSGFSIAFKNLDWSPEAVFDALLEHAPDAQVSSAKVEDIRLSAGVQARIVFAGNDKDIRSRIKKFLKNDSITFSSLKIEFSFAGRKRSCEVRSSGVIQNYGDYDPVITTLWLKALQSLSAGNNKSKT